MAEYDLTPTLAHFLDRHLVLALVEFVDVQKLYDPKEILQQKIVLLESTKLVDSATDCYQKLGVDVPESLKRRREVVVAELERRSAEIAPVQKFLDNESIVEQLRQDKTENLEFLTKNHEFKVEYLDVLYNFAKFEFDCGNYAAAAEHLTFYCVLSTDVKKSASALWGKCASEILLQNWDAALEDITELRDFIDNKSILSQVEQLQARSWLIHWSLFVFFNHPRGNDSLMDMFFHPAYLNAIQTTCPHILRYLTTAVITNKKRHRMIKDLVKVISNETTYRDPVIELLECLYVNFDFDAAQHKLRECEKVLANDFFLLSCRNEFLQNARLFIFETYCRIHHVIQLSMLAEKLNMSAEEAERWIVDLIRNARLDAKIDSATGTVVMGTQVKSIYQKIIEATKELSIRSQNLAADVDKRVYQQSRQERA